MFIADEITGDITLRQGDNGKYTITGIPTDKNYFAYFSVLDENRNKIGEELVTNTNYLNHVSFTFQPDFTDLFVVKKGEDNAIYEFGVKLKFGVNYIEDTLVIGNKDISAKNTITVLPKLSDGGV